MKGFFAEFKEFAMKGNAFDLAIGVIIGASFGKIVTSLVNDIIMPAVGLIVGKVNFTDLFINFSGGDYATLAAAKAAGAATLNYGAFLQNVLDFLIVAFTIFMTIKMLNRLTQKKTAEAEVPKP